MIKINLHNITYMGLDKITKLLGVDADAIQAAHRKDPSMQTLTLRRFHLDIALCIMVRERLPGRALEILLHFSYATAPPEWGGSGC